MICESKNRHLGHSGMSCEYGHLSFKDAIVLLQYQHISNYRTLGSTISISGCVSAFRLGMDQ